MMGIEDATVNVDNDNKGHQDGVGTTRSTARAIPIAISSDAILSNTQTEEMPWALLAIVIALVGDPVSAMTTTTTRATKMWDTNKRSTARAIPVASSSNGISLNTEMGEMLGHCWKL